MSEFENPWRLRSSDYWGLARWGRRTAATGRSIRATSIDDARSGAPERVDYVYRGTGRDTLTAFMDDEPDDAGRLTRRQERMEALTSLPPVHDGPEPAPPPGRITAAQAAGLLGVSTRTVERYKRELARRAS